MIGYLISFLAVMGYYGVSRGQTWGWIVGLLAQPIWVLYGWQIHQPGLIIVSLLYCYVNIKGLRTSLKRNTV